MSTRGRQRQYLQRYNTPHSVSRPTPLVIVARKPLLYHIEFPQM